MARTSEDAVVPHEETAIQAFANSNLTPEQSRRQAAPFLNSKELLRDFLRLSPEDQAKFVERIDQVGRERPLFSPEPSLHRFFKGLPDRQPAKREVRNRPRERVQRDRTTPNFSRTFRGAQETREHRRSIWGIERHLARRMGWHAGGY